MQGAQSRSRCTCRRSDRFGETALTLKMEDVNK
jgi:hypothetical protein